jgi:ABC-type branched-subunit amino acid transport system substrate-binding protein
LGVVLTVAISTFAGFASTPVGAAAKKPVVKVMTMSSWNDPEVNLQDLAVIGQDAGKYLNSHGGLNGAKVDVIICNDNFTESGAETCAHDAVADHVAAVVGGISVFDGSVLPIISANHIPWIGELPFQTNAFTAKDFFPITDGTGLVEGVVAQAAAKACTSVALVDAGAGSAGEIAFLNAGMKTQNKTFVATIPVSTNSPDFATFAQQIISSGATCLVEDINYTESELLISALVQAGASFSNLHVYASAAGGYASQVVNAYPTVVQGWTVASTFTTSFDSAKWSAYRQTMAADDNLGALAPNISNMNDMNSWAAYQVLQSVAKKIKGKVTGPTLIKALNSSSKLTDGGLTPAINFTKPSSVPSLSRIVNPYVGLYTSVNGKLVSKGSPVNAIKIYQQGTS